MPYELSLNYDTSRNQYDIGSYGPISLNEIDDLPADTSPDDGPVYNNNATHLTFHQTFKEAVEKIANYVTAKQFVVVQREEPYTGNLSYLLMKPDIKNTGNDEYGDWKVLYRKGPKGQTYYIS